MFFAKPPRIEKEKENFLNLGCGQQKQDAWVNADFFSYLKKDKPDWELDFRFPMKCDDNVWDGVFCEHALEHLYPNHALDLLKEVKRTLKPGKRLRLTVPDLDKAIKYYNGKEMPEKYSERWPTGAEAVRSISQNWGHISLWNCELLTEFLKEAGFQNIKQVECKKGTDKKLLIDVEARQWETLYIEAQKSE
ncbi:MAG: methyltransferase domain-containing protein [Alphaproteobacteria bacterium]|nr:methyltransferase domain-containing protein [Alphaproteobacteria bacterium]